MKKIYNQIAKTVSLLSPNYLRNGFQVFFQFNFSIFRLLIQFIKGNRILQTFEQAF